MQITKARTASKISYDTQALASGLVVVIFSGLSLGVLAYVVDSLPGEWGLAIRELVSSGLCWGLVVFGIGYRASTAIKAAVAGVSTLLLATITYYGLILILSSDRWRGGMMEDGSSAAIAGLASIARAFVFWAAIAIGVGIVLGVLGYGVRARSKIEASVASGSAFGLLASQGIFVALFVNFGDSALLVPAIASILLALAAAIGALVGRIDRSWLAFVAASAAIGSTGVFLWWLIYMVRISRC